MSGSLTQLYLSNPALATAIRRQKAGMDMAQEASSVAPASPWQALARLANAYVGTKMASGAEGDIRAEGDRMRQEARDFMGGDLPMGGGVPQGGQPQSLPAPSTGGGYTDLIDQREGRGQNPLSSANGIGQFTNGTWMQFAQANPQRFQGMDPQQVLAARNDPAIARDAIEWYGAQNAPLLQSAGVQPTNGAKGLAHFLGPSVAAAMWKADPNASAASIIQTSLSPDQAAAYLKANPQLAQQTAGQVAAPYRAWDGGGGMPQGSAPRADPQSGQYMALAQEYLRRYQAAEASTNPFIKAQAPAYKAQADMYAKLGMEKPQTKELAPGAVLLSPDGRVIYRNEDRDQQPVVIQDGVDENGQPKWVYASRGAAVGKSAPPPHSPAQPVVVQNGVDEKGNPRWVYASRDAAIGQSAPTPGPMVTVDQRGPNAEATERGQTLAKQAAALRDQADVAASTIDQVRQLRNIGAETSRLAPAKELIGSVLDALGVKDTTRVRDAQTLQAFNGALSAIVLGEQLRQKGVQTEGDAARMREQFAKATNTMEANDLLMRMVEGAAMRQMERADFYEKWYAQNKTYDGAQGAWTRFIRDVPMTLRGAGGVKFYHEGRDAAAAEGISPEEFDAQWKAAAARK